MGGRVARQPGITDRQRAALARVSGVLPASAYLAGGVAVALRCGHRSSVDLDLFTPEDPIETSLPALERLEGVTITLRKPRTLYLEIEGVPVSLLAYDYPHLAPPERIEGLPVPLASVPDLVTMKLSAIADRGARRDFWDLHELFELDAISLEAALELQSRRYPRYDIGHVVRALVYFADGETSPLLEGLSEERWDAIKTDFRTWVRAYASR